VTNFFKKNETNNQLSSPDADALFNHRPRVGRTSNGMKKTETIFFSNRLFKS